MAMLKRDIKTHQDSNGGGKKKTLAQTNHVLVN